MMSPIQGKLKSFEQTRENEKRILWYIKTVVKARKLISLFDGRIITSEGTDSCQSRGVTHVWKPEHGE